MCLTDLQLHGLFQRIGQREWISQTRISATQRRLCTATTMPQLRGGQNWLCRTWQSKHSRTQLKPCSLIRVCKLAVHFICCAFSPNSDRTAKQQPVWAGSQLHPQEKGAQQLQLCGPCLLWPNGWLDQYVTWYRGRPRPRPHCVRWDHDKALYLALYANVDKLHKFHCLAQRLIEQGLASH